MKILFNYLIVNKMMILGLVWDGIIALSVRVRGTSISGASVKLHQLQEILRAAEQLHIPGGRTFEAFELAAR